jgi:hypothetical protein
MSARNSVLIGAVGMVSPLGFSARAIGAAVRSGIPRFQESEFFNREGLPIVMACAPLAQLAAAREESAGGASSIDVGERSGRMLLMAAAALEDCLSTIPFGEAPPLYLALPDDLPQGPQFATELFTRSLLAELSLGGRTPLDLIVDRGRASGIRLLQQAAAQITTRWTPMSRTLSSAAPIASLMSSCSISWT